MPRARSYVHLREWLTHMDMTAEELAETLNTSKSVMSKLESTGQRWNQDWLEEVAFVFQCDVRDLFSHPRDRRAMQIGLKVLEEMAEDTQKPEPVVPRKRSKA